MNHTIIRKALDEALTRKYYDELMGCDDEDYIFGTAFTADMKRLIRKTDDKLLYYSKYAAIAACACIAIGCAVLLPNLINSGVNVEPPVTTTPAVESSTTTPEETSLPIIITTTEGTTAVSSTTTPETTPDTDPTETSELTTLPPVTTTEDDEAVDDAVTDGGIIDDDADTDADTDADSPDTGGIILPDDGDDCVALPEDEDEETELDSADDVTIDGDIVDEEDDDCDIEEDDDVEIEDDTDSDSVDINYPEGNTFKEIYEIYTERKLEDTKVLKVTITNADDNNQVFLSGKIFDLSFVGGYIISQGDSVRLDKSAEDGSDVSAENELKGEGRSIFVELGEGELINDVIFYDSSRRENYGEFFRGEFSEDEDVEAEVESYNYLTGIKIYENGAAFYRGCVPMQFDSEATAELFRHFDKMGLPDFTNSVDELLDYAEITEDSIISGVAKIFNVYDITISGVNLDTEAEIAGLWDIIDSFKGAKCAPSSANGQIEIKFYVSETFSTIKLIISDIFTANPNLFIADNEHAYLVDITQEKAQEIIRYICKCAGVAEPYFYVTAEEYLDYVGVEFEGVKEISARGEINGSSCTYRITDPEKINKLTEMLKVELKNTKYNGSSSSVSWLYADFRMEHWSLCLCEGYIKVGPYAASCFEISPDILTKVNKYISENADETIVEEIDVEDDHAVEDDVDIEEEIDD